ncbi:hypothetical protein JTB14_006733 [Gonioctena quinquepunctata]|nr:hypothetical protein JTB14_006733 [Gonioctena quinquepunctata]
MQYQAPLRNRIPPRYWNFLATNYTAKPPAANCENIFKISLFRSLIEIILGMLLRWAGDSSGCDISCSGPERVEYIIWRRFILGMCANVLANQGISSSLEDTFAARRAARIPIRDQCERGRNTKGNLSGEM